MKRIVTFKCDLCGKDFSTPFDCKEHESRCINRKYLLEQYKKRLRKFIKLIEKQQIIVSIRYDSTGNDLISLYDTTKK